MLPVFFVRISSGIRYSVQPVEWAKLIREFVQADDRVERPKQH